MSAWSWSKLFVYDDALQPSQKKPCWDFFCLHLHFCFLCLILFLMSLGWTWIEQGLMCLAQRHNTVLSVSLKPTTPLSHIKHSTIRLLPSLERCSTKQWIKCLTQGHVATLTIHHLRCTVFCGSELFAKIISRWQKSPLARKELKPTHWNCSWMQMFT